MVTDIKWHTTQEDVDAVFLVGEGDRFVLQNVLRWPVMSTKAKENNSLREKDGAFVGNYPVGMRSHFPLFYWLLRSGYCCFLSNFNSFKFSDLYSGFTPVLPCLVRMQVRPWHGDHAASDGVPFRRELGLS